MSLAYELGCRALASHDRSLGMQVADGWKTFRAVEVLVVEDRERLAMGEASQA